LPHIVFNHFALNYFAIVKNQALLMLMAKIEKYVAENNRFEAKYALIENPFLGS